METIKHLRELNISYKKKVKYSNITGAENASEFIRKILPNNSQEHFVALFLDAAHQPIAYSVICTGLVSSCPIHPRELFQRALLVGACSVIIAHNHPSGNSTPSPEDHQVTKQLVEAGKTIGVKILDHVIVTDDDYLSFCEKNYL